MMMMMMMISTTTKKMMALLFLLACVFLLCCPVVCEAWRTPVPVPLFKNKAKAGATTTRSTTTRSTTTTTTTTIPKTTGNNVHSSSSDTSSSSSSSSSLLDTHPVTTTTRTQFLTNTFASTVVAVASTAAATSSALIGLPSASIAAETDINNNNNNINNIDSKKLLNLSDDELRSIILKDVLENKFLATGRLTRSIYDESATFTDEIDTYTLDQWIRGTQRLFLGDRSRVDLIYNDNDNNNNDNNHSRDAVQVTHQEVRFRFDEDLVFNLLPFFQPTVSLTGTLLLKRDPNTGLITSYREFWDQDVLTVLKTARF